MLTSVAFKLKPFAGMVAFLALGCFLGAIALLVLAVSVFESLYTVLFFLAWPLMGVTFGSIGLLIVVALYTRVLPDPTQGGLAAVDYWWNRVGRVVFAPLITLWFCALCLMLVAGLVIGVLHFVKWIGLI